MHHWIEVCTEQRIPLGCYETIEYGAWRIAVYHIRDGFFAFEDLCTHNPCPLSGGPLQGDQITCMMHGARFCIKDGRPLGPPAHKPLRCFPIKVADGRVWVDVA